MFGSYNGGNSMSNGNSFAEARETVVTEPPLLFPDPWRRLP